MVAHHEVEKSRAVPGGHEPLGEPLLEMLPRFVERTQRPDLACVHQRGLQRKMRPPHVAKRPLGVAREERLLLLARHMLMEHIAPARRRMPAQQAAHQGAVGQRLRVVAVENHLGEGRLRLQDIGRPAHVGQRHEELPVVLQVQPVRRSHGIAQQVHAACMALVRRPLEDELEERVALTHARAIAFAGVVVHAHEALDAVQVLTAVQEGVHRALEQFEALAGGDRQRRVALAGAPARLQPLDDGAGVLRGARRHGRCGKVAVGLHARPLGLGQQVAIEQLHAQAKALQGLAEPIGGNCRLIPGAPAVHARIEKQQIIGHGQRHRGTRVDLRPGPFPTPAMPARQGHQRLDARRALLVGGQVGGAYLLRGALQTLCQHGGLVERIPHLFVPAPHAGTGQVGLAGLFGLAGIAPALRKVERVAGIAGVLAQGFFQQGCVLAESQRVAAARALVPALHPRPIDRGDVVRNIRRQIFMHHAHPTPGQPGGDHQALPVACAAAVQVQVVGRRIHCGPAPPRRGMEQVVRIHEQQVVRALHLHAGKFQRLGAVVPEVTPGPFMERARQVRQAAADEGLRAIGGTRVHDDPAVNEGPDGGEAAFDDACLVLDDHVEADHKACARAQNTGGTIARRWRGT